MYPTLVLVLVSLATRTKTVLVHNSPPQVLNVTSDPQDARPNRRLVEASGQDIITIGRLPDDVLHGRSVESIDSRTAVKEEEEKEGTGSGLFVESTSVHYLA